jgi:two-component system, NarL family, invasion response regulator UvrY
MTDVIRVIVADDHAVVRKGVELVLQRAPGMVLAGEATDSQGALELATQTPCDVVVLDLEMPGSGGLEVLKELRRRKPDVPVLILSTHDEHEYGPRVIRAGAAGFLAKVSALEEIVRAIRTVRRGERYVSPALAEMLAGGMAEPRSVNPHETLSDREYQVFLGLVSGKTPTDLATELALSVKTVSTYRARVLDKLRVRNNADLVRYALELRLIA